MLDSQVKLLGLAVPTKADVTLAFTKSDLDKDILELARKLCEIDTKDTAREPAPGRTLTVDDAD